jgi:hypothetical protein
VFDGAFLRARLTLPRKGATALYVTFRQRIDQPGTFSEDGPVRQALQRGMGHLHIQSLFNDWYLNAETAALEHALGKLRSGFATARAVGYSMGGYGAMRFAAALRLDQALVVSPQFTLDRAVIPEDRRYREATSFDGRLGDLARHGKPDLQGVVVFDPSHPLDRRHAVLIRGAMPAMAPAACMFGGHPASGALRAAGGFRAFQGLGLDGGLTAEAVVRLHRQLRAGSSRYWHFRARACIAKGWANHAEVALARAEALAGGDVE